MKMNVVIGLLVLVAVLLGWIVVELRAANASLVSVRTNVLIARDRLPMGR